MRTYMPQRFLALAMIAALAATAGVASAQSSKGRIRGRVTDAANGNPLPGVTVTVTSPALQGEQTEFTDEDGNYLITELPPGDYLVRFYFADIVSERSDIQLSAGTTLNVSQAIQTDKATATTVDIVERAPTVDVGSTAQKTVIDSEIVKRTPVRGRTYESVLTNAPGASTDEVGYSFNGATGPENTFLIDGLNSTNPAYGLVGTRLSLEFIDETQIITGGYQAEYGRATGGLVNIVTKAGSNEFKGDLWLNYTPFQLDGRRIGRLGEAVVREQNRQFREMDFGFGLGGPIVKDRIWFYLGFAPSYTKERYKRYVQRRLGNNAASAPAGSVYRGDIDNSQVCPDYLKDRDPSLCPTGAFLTEDVSDQNFYSNSWLMNYMGRLDFAIDSDNTLTLQYLGSPSTFSGVFDNPNDANSLGLGFNSEMRGGYFEEDIWVHDILGTYTSKLLDRKLQVELKVGYHAETYTVTPREGSISRVINIPERSLGEYEGIASCRIQVLDNGTTFNPCPVTNYGTGGFGFSNDIEVSRLTAALGVTLFGQLVGTHELKLGGDFELNSYFNRRFYTGLGVLTDFGGGSVERDQFGTRDKDDKIVLTPEGFAPTTESWRQAMYLRDSWQPSFFPGFTLDLGARLEFEQVKDVNGETVIGLYTNFAPRLGFVYDWTQKGLSKVFAHYGRFYEAIPLDINDRQFSGEGILNQEAADCSRDARGVVVPGTCNFVDPNDDPTASLNGGSFGVVQPSLKGQFTNYISAGVEVDVGWDVVLGASFVHSDLGRVIEDISSDGATTYIIANPGEPIDEGTVSDLQADIIAANAAVTAAGMDMDALAKAVESRDKAVDTLRQYRAVQNSPKPTRDYNALVLTATKKFKNNWLVQASYAYSRTIGNYPGLFQASNGQLDPNISSQLDIPELAANRDGPLPNDRPHNAKLLVSYFIPTSGTEEDGLNVGLRFSASSGAPIEVLGRHPLYGPSETFILPRGAGGRLPMLTTLDLLASYKFGPVELSASIFNLLNTRTPTNVDQQYTLDRVMPITNGSIADLTTLKNTDANPVTRNPNFGNPTAYQAPLYMRLGLRIAF